MDLEEVTERFPRRYHMAQNGSWPLIQRLGLLCTSALLDAFDVGLELREALLCHRRPTSVEITRVASERCWKSVTAQAPRLR